MTRLRITSRSSLAVGSAQRLRDGDYHFDAGYVVEPDGTWSYSIEVDPSGRIMYEAKANTILLDPVLVDNLTDAGKAQLKAWQSVPGMDPLWPLSLSIEGWTTYDPNTVPSSCKGA